jgi:hypothetical protein
VSVMDDGRLVAEVPMERFKNGIKRLRVANAPAAPGRTPFGLLSREAGSNGTETWVVRDWHPDMGRYFEQVGAALKDVIDLDLEEGFVELLRGARSPAA